EWRADAPATAVWVEALDGGDPSTKTETRDRLFALAAPFTGAPVALATLGLRYDDVTWGNGDTALVAERWWKNRQDRLWRIRPDTPGAPPPLPADRSYEDRHNDPGDRVTVPNAAGRQFLLTADGGRTIYLA